MHKWKLWLVAVFIELVLVAIGRHLEATNASLGEGVAIALTQMPGSRLSQRILGANAPLWQLDSLMAVIQILILGLVLQILNFAWRRFRNRDLKS